MQKQVNVVKQAVEKRKMLESRRKSDFENTNKKSNGKSIEEEEKVTLKM